MQSEQYIHIFTCDVTGFFMEIRDDSSYGREKFPSGWGTSEIPEWLLTAWKKDRTTLPDSANDLFSDKTKRVTIHFSNKDAYEEFWKTFFGPYLKMNFTPKQFLEEPKKEDKSKDPSQFEV